MPQERYIVLGDSIKSVGSNRFGGYLVRFTSPDEPDLHGEYFDKDTYFGIENYPIKGEPVLYNHGMDDALEDIPIGRIDFVEIRDDGIYVEAQDTFRESYASHVKALRAPDEWKAEQLKQLDEYERMLKDLRDRGMMKWSSGAQPQSVRTTRITDKASHIDRWFIREGSNTLTPAEPSKTRIYTLKSFAETLKGLSDDRSSVNESDNHNQSFTVTRTLKMELTPEQMQALEALVAAFQAPAQMAISEDEEIKAEGDMPPDEEDELTDKAKSAMLATAKRLISKDSGVQADFDKNVKSAVQNHMADIIGSYVDTYITERTKKANDMKVAAQQALQLAKKNAPAVGLRETLGGVGDGTKGAGRTQSISVSEPLKYAHLPADEMALAIKLVASSMNANTVVPRPVTFGEIIDTGILSEDFVKSAIHKISREIDLLDKPKFSDAASKADYHAVKSARPFKANELDSTAIATQGAEWTSIFYDPTLWDRAREVTNLYDMMVARGMRVVTIPQGSETMDVKIDTGSAKVYTVPEAQSTDSAGNPENIAQLQPFTTSNVQATAKTHMLAQGYTYKLDEDSIINIAAFLNTDMMQVLAESLEITAINGDTTTAASTNISYINGTPATGLSTPDYIAWDGIRHNYIIENTGYRTDKSGAALTFTDYETVRHLMPTAIRNRIQNLLFIIDEGTESAHRKLTSIMFKDTAGDDATAFRSTLFPPFGIEVYSSFAQYKADSAGKITRNASLDPTGTLGQISLVYPPYWQYGRKRSVMIETQRFPGSQSVAVYASVRHVMKARSAAAAAGMINILI